MKKLLNKTRRRSPVFKFDLKMKLSILFILVTFFSLKANDSYAQRAKITLEYNNIRIGQIIDEIESKTEFQFVYKIEDVDLDRIISIGVNNEKIDDILNQIFKNTRTTFNVNDRRIYLLKRMDTTVLIPNKVVYSSPVLQEIISGSITDKDGNPLPGANIVEKGTNNGVTADFDGNFSIEVANKNITLVVSYIGYATKEFPINGNTTVSIILEESAAGLDEVIVVGFGKQSSRKVVSAVAQVSGEQLQVDERPVTSIQSALVGSIPGLRGFNANGRPGSAPGFAIRGNSSLNNTNILVIIDGFEGSLSDVNPQSIESVSILKDAAAVAVYGARGANGVMLVTTKETRRGESLSISYSLNTSIQSPRELPKTLNSLELMEFENFAVTGDPAGGNPYSAVALELARNGFYPETVWPEELYNNSAGQQSHNLAISGGSEKTGYLINASYLDQKGLVIGADNFKRLNLRLKLDTDIGKWLTVGTNTLITNRITNQTPANGGNGLLGSPFYPVRSIDGLWVDKGSPGTANPIAEAASGSFVRADRDALNVQLYAQLKPFKGLVFEQRVSLLKTNENTRDWNNVYDFVTLDFSDPDSYSNPESASRSYSNGSADARRLRVSSFNEYSFKSLSTLNYEWSNNVHSMKVLLGFQSEQGENEYVIAGRTGFLLDNVIDLSLGQAPDVGIGGGIGNASSRGGNATTLSYFGRLNYDYKGRYLAEVSFRRDGSSNFLDNNKWAFFPAVAFGWNVAEEAFMKEINFIDQFKLRGSYGKSGDDSGVGRRVVQLVNLDVTGYPIGGAIQPSLNLGSPASRDLKWETATTLNVGLDFSLWSGKLQVNSEYFVTDREDILDEVITPIEFGLGNVPANLYAVKSWGWELSATHKNNIGAVSYWLSGNITGYDNEITDLAGREQVNFAVGQSINDWFGYKTDGFFDSQQELDSYVQDDGVTPVDQSNVGGTYLGGYKFVDQLTVDTNDDGIPDAKDGVINGDDRIILKQNSDTNLNIGFNLGVSYKGLSLSARFYGALDRKQWWSGADAHEPFLNGTNAFDYQLNYWRPDNPDAYFPVPQGNGIQGYSSDISHLIFDNEFIKFQNITLGYEFDRELLQRIGFLSGLNFSLSFENLGTVWTNSPVRENGWDPELGIGNVDYPLPFTTSLGINLKF